MIETVITFTIDILKHNISLTSDTILNVSDSQDKLQILRKQQTFTATIYTIICTQIVAATFHSPKYPTKTFNTLQTPEICGGD